MSDKISEARQALRDYAREGVAIDGRNLKPNALNEGIQYIGARGEIGGKAFVAAQAALTVAEELRAESRQQPVIWNDDADLRAKAEAADRIEAAVLKALA